jgi:hypothetical protein
VSTSRCLPSVQALWQLKYGHHLPSSTKRWLKVCLFVFVCPWTHRRWMPKCLRIPFDLFAKVAFLSPEKVCFHAGARCILPVKLMRMSCAGCTNIAVCSVEGAVVRWLVLLTVHGHTVCTGHIRLLEHLRRAKVTSFQSVVASWTRVVPLPSCA